MSQIILWHLKSAPSQFTELEIRRGFTTFQLMTILEEAYHSLIIIEYDPVLYEDFAEMVEYIAQTMKQAFS